ncbi:SDP1 [Symbiodinium pilosum]|uniref:SDP1 protein n=1 Tax=Symbiodinium pilosum TaxID=2952 RepID=A0A812JNS7_SYMPI|nr:SDP1 [Symbiodinium pilosum]
MADGIIVIVMSIPGLYAVVCCGQAQGLNKCLLLPTLVLMVWGYVTYNNPDELDLTSTTTTTTTSTTTTTGTGIAPIVIEPCDDLKIKAGLILLTQAVAPLALCNLIVGVLGGAGLVSGLLTFPAAVALCTAIAQWDAECHEPLVTWLFIHGLLLSLVPGTPESVWNVSVHVLHYWSSYGHSPDIIIIIVVVVVVVVADVFTVIVTVVVMSNSINIITLIIITTAAPAVPFL